MRIAIHQPNLCAWLPFFYKMKHCDVFVLLIDAQFEKGGYQNRFNYKGKWITKPVKNGIESIRDKEYTDGNSVAELNSEWIKVIAKTLSIETEIVESRRWIWESKILTPSEKLAKEVKENRGKEYLTNKEALSKYLEEKPFLDQGVSLDLLSVPKNLNISIFEAFETFGIEGTKKLIEKRAK